MAQKLKVVQAFDRAVITEIPTDDSQALESKLACVSRVMRERDAWLKPAHWKRGKHISPAYRPGK